MTRGLLQKFRLGASKDEIDEMPVADCGSKDSRDAKPVKNKNFYGESAPTQS